MVGIRAYADMQLPKLRGITEEFYMPGMHDVKKTRNEDEVLSGFLPRGKWRYP